MYRRILVAIDDSQVSRQTFARALSIAKAFDAKLHLLHVISLTSQIYPDIAPSFGSGLGYSTIPYEDLIQQQEEQKKLLEQQGFKLLESLSKEALAAGVDTEFTQQEGSADREICKFAKMWEADLIAVGSHGKTGLSEFFEGSVSNYVSHHVPCSVLIVHSDTESSSLPTDTDIVSPK